MPPARPRIAAALALALVVVLVLAGSAVVSSGPVAASTSNPPANLPWDGATCAPTGTAQPNDSATCLSLDLQHINAARAAEGVGPMSLPSDYLSLSPAQQLFVAVDRERVDRGLAAAAGITEQLDQLSSQGAGHGTDPPFPPGRDWGGAVWAGGFASTLEAIYGWMYNDGPGSDNEACTSAGQPGCWEHRQILLTTEGGSSLASGAASGAGAWGTEYAVELIHFSGSAGPFIFTWLQAIGNAVVAIISPPTTAPPTTAAPVAAPKPPTTVAPPAPTTTVARRPAPAPPPAPKKTVTPHVALPPPHPAPKPARYFAREAGRVLPHRTTRSARRRVEVGAITFGVAAALLV